MCLMLHLYLTLACLFFSFMCVSQDPARSHSSCEERFSPIFNWERAPSISSLHSLLMKSTFNVAGKGRWRTIYISNLGILIFDLLSGCNQGHVRKDQVLLGSCSSPDLHLLILLWTSWMLFFSLWAGMDDGQDASAFSALGNFISRRECSQVDILSLPRRMEAPLFSQRWGLTSWSLRLVDSLHWLGMGCRDVSVSLATSLLPCPHLLLNWETGIWRAVFLSASLFFFFLRLDSASRLLSRECVPRVHNGPRAPDNQRQGKLRHFSYPSALFLSAVFLVGVWQCLPPPGRSNLSYFIFYKISLLHSCPKHSLSS